jgi:hypothetical protein
VARALTGRARPLAARRVECRRDGDP